MLVRKALVHAVADGAVVVQRSENFADLVQHLLDADHIQEGLLLPGKRSIRQIFGRGGGPDGKRRLRVASAQRRKRFTYGLLQISRKWLRLNQGTDFGADQGQGPHVFGIERAQTGVDATSQILVGQKIAKRMCRRGKAGRHFDASRQVRNHLAEAGIFATNRLDVGHPQVFKRYDQGGRVE